jgi:ADP-ribose pyrophosphatase YjhB (NUDIX family)
VTFVSVAVRNARNWILLQERDENAPLYPEMWCLPGGGVDEGEENRGAAVRELAEETGLATELEGLTSVGTTRFFNNELGDHDDFELFHVFLDVGDSDVVCGEGRQMVFVDPTTLDDLDLIPAARMQLEQLGARNPDSSNATRLFASVVLVDREGRILLQERDEHARIDPEAWGLAGGHVEPGEDFEPAAYRELEEETGVRLAPGTLALFGEFVVDHTRAHGTWDRMQVFVAATDLTDADIDCREGRQIVFVEPDVARGLDLTSAAADVVPAFLDSPLYASMTP